MPAPAARLRPLLMIAAGALACAAQAADLPAPKVMSGAPPDKGSWRMDMLEYNGAPPQGAQALASGITVCTTAARAMDRADAEGERRRCTQRYVENSEQRAVLEVSCAGDPPSRARSTITREGATSWLVATDSTRDGRTDRVKLRMSYAGACDARNGAISLGKDSPVCRGAAAQLEELDASRRCGEGTPAERAACAERMEQMRARIAQLCR